MRLGKRILGIFAGIMCLGALASCTKGGSESTTKEEIKLYDEINYSGDRDNDPYDDSFPATRTSTSEEKINYASKDGFFVWFKSKISAKITSIDLTITYKQGDWCPEGEYNANYYTYIINPASESLVTEYNIPVFNCQDYLLTHPSSSKSSSTYPAPERNIPYSSNYAINRTVEKENYFIFYLHISDGTFSNLKINYEKI